MPSPGTPASFHLASVTGPAIGGAILLKTVTGAYVLHVATALWYILCLALIETTPQVVSKEPVTLKSLGAGLQAFVLPRLILATITLDLFAVLLGGAVCSSRRLPKSNCMSARWASACSAPPGGRGDLHGHGPGPPSADAAGRRGMLFGQWRGLAWPRLSLA